MKRLLSLAASLLLAAGAFAQQDGAYSQLKEGFTAPPDDARPRVWWHWMNGNITRDGLFKDMDWMYRSGVRGFHIFDANFDTPQIVNHRVEFLSDEWKGIFRDVIARADELGMEVTIASSPGFSSSGGPWVGPEDAMKKLVWRQMDVEGGCVVERELPEPYDVTGVYQNIRRTGKYKYYSDIAVLAIRLPDEDRTLSELGAEVTSSSGSFTVSQLSDGDYANGSDLEADPAGYSWIQYSFPDTVTVRAVTLRNLRTRGERHSNLPSCVDSLQVSDDGTTWRTVTGIPIGCCLVQTFDIEPVSSRYFRLKHANVPSSYNYVHDRTTPAPKFTRIDEFVLHTVTRVNHSEEKAEFGSAHDLRNFPTPETDAAAPLAIDLTDKVADGVLRWDAPEGRWRVIRFGCSLTGKENHPASPEATGLEVDKLDPDAWTRYFRRYLDVMKDAAGGLLGERGIQYVLEDSYEAEFQNWTPRMREQFLARRGYDCLPWMPALAGIVLENSAATEQFLHDWRKTLGELFYENYALLTDIVRNEYGMKGCYIESHANGSIFPADGMSIKKTASFPMGEMWIQGKVSSEFRDTEGTADIKESSSVAHIYGQQYAAAESMTAIGLAQQAWTYCPENMKHTADRELKAGVNRFVLHDSAAQPLDDKFPGLGLGVYGHWFNRHECWAEQAGVWMDYLARSSYMLSRGRNVADILWYFGEETNLTSYYSRRFPDVPRGYEFDYAGADALLNEITCADGVLRAGSGAEYRAIYVDPVLTYFSPEVLAKLSDLEANGAVVCGQYGGRYIPLKDALEAAGIAPDVEYEGDGSIDYLHRTCGDLEIYWVKNNSYETLSKSLSFRVSGKVPQIWHPEDARIEKVPFSEVGGRTVVDLDFVPDDAYFVVFSDSADSGARKRRDVYAEPKMTITDPWYVSFQKGRRAPEIITLESLRSLSESDDPGVRYFSGTAEYRCFFRVKNPSLYTMIDLGSVRNIAEVYLNGKSLGTVWKTPFCVNLKGSLKKGLNILEVRVTNTWPNRLIGDAQPEEKNPLTYTAFRFYKADDPLLESGLLGPVTLR